MKTWAELMTERAAKEHDPEDVATQVMDEPQQKLLLDETQQKPLLDETQESPITAAASTDVGDVNDGATVINRPPLRTPSDIINNPFSIDADLESIPSNSSVTPVATDVASGVAEDALGMGLGVFGGEAAMDAAQTLMTSVKNNPGSIHEFTPDDAGGSSGSDVSTQTLLAALNKIAGNRSRV